MASLEYKPKNQWYKCPKCDRLVWVNGSICKNCGELLSSSELMRQDEARTKKRKLGNAISRAASFALLALLVLGRLHDIGVFDFPKTNLAPATEADRERTEMAVTSAAYTFAKRIVQERLEVPSTAKFPEMSQTQIRKVDSATFIINSYVDSQNVFGAMVRTHYKAKVMCSGYNVMFAGNRSWKLLDLQME